MALVITLIIFSLLAYKNRRIARFRSVAKLARSDFHRMLRIRAQCSLGLLTYLSEHYSDMLDSRQPEKSAEMQLLTNLENLGHTDPVDWVPQHEVVFDEISRELEMQTKMLSGDQRCELLKRELSDLNARCRSLRDRYTEELHRYLDYTRTFSSVFEETVPLVMLGNIGLLLLGLKSREFFDKDQATLANKDNLI